MIHLHTQSRSRIGGLNPERLECFDDGGLSSLLGPVGRDLPPEIADGKADSLQPSHRVEDLFTVRTPKLDGLPGRPMRRLLVGKVDGAVPKRSLYVGRARCNHLRLDHQFVDVTLGRDGGGHNTDTLTTRHQLAGLDLNRGACP